MRTTRIAILVTVASITAVGCPGKLEDPDRFAGTLACRNDIDVRALFVQKCGSAICHGGQLGTPSANLDLTEFDLGHELVGVESTTCPGFLRVDPTNPDQSFLLAKIIDPPAGCGDRMPLIGVLSQDEIACIRAFVHQIAGEPVVVDGGVDAGSDAGIDSGADAGTDADVDGGSDADVDGGSDAEVDATMDASSDADMDGGG